MRLTLGGALALTCFLVLSACGEDDGDGTTATGGVPADEQGSDEPRGDDAPPVVPGDGLGVRILGEIQGDLLCPNGRRPCIAFVGEIEPEGDRAWVSGRLIGGVLHVDDQQPIPPDFVIPDYSNQCPDQGLGPVEAYEALEPMMAGDAPQPDGFVDLWDSDDGVLHIGVAGEDASAVEAWLADNGLAGQLCIVTGLPYPIDLLRGAQRALHDTAPGLGYTDLSSSADPRAGEIEVWAPRVDVAFRALLDEISANHGGVPFVVWAGVEVLDGSLEDYEAALDAGAVAPDASEFLRVSCGPAVFSSIPPDIDEFPPLDDDARAAIHELANGETSVEAAGWDTDFDWSIASRTDDELVLFGQGSGPDGPHYVDARFRSQDGEWRPSGWGGCHFLVDAPGLGPAEVSLDPSRPIDPYSTELPLHITERACASGQPPVDREVVPVVIETDESVTVIVLVAPVEGGADCPGNPPHPITVTLEAPLGDRALLDGHVQPAVPVG